MKDLYTSAVGNMTKTIARLERVVPAPQVVVLRGRKNYRYKEQSIHQAIIMKLARLISALQAARLLLNAGLLQDFGACQRVIDEINEDVAYLYWLTVGKESPNWHERFFAEFWQEEFDGPTAMTSNQKRDRVPREKIRNFLASMGDVGLDQNTRIKVAYGISKAYSGFIHGAASHIIEMYYGDPPKFHALNQRDSPYLEGHIEDLQNVFFRSICTFGLAAAAFGDGDLKDTILDFRTHFEKQCGMTFDPKELDAIALRQRQARPSNN